MSRLPHFFQILGNVIRNYGDYVQGRLVYLAFFSVLGILVPYTSFSWLSILLTLLLLGFIIFRHHFSLIVLSLFTLFFFMCLFILIDSTNQTTLAPTTKTIKAEIVDSPDINGDKFSVIVNTSQNEKLLMVYYIQTELEKIQLSQSVQMGLVCTFNGTLKKPQVSRNPYSFDYQKYLYAQQIHWIFEANTLTPEKCFLQKKWSLGRWLLKIREAGIHQIDSHFDGSTAGIIQALIYGERTNIENEIVNSYQSLGLIHLLAISGLHVSLMTGMFYFLCIRFGVTRESTSILLLCLLPAYIVIAGGSPSVIRSVLMCMLLFASILWWKKGSMLDVISFVFIFMLAINPYFLFNIGFQLSFMVSASLILSSKAIFKHYSNTLASLFAVSFLSQIASLLILLYHFFEFSLLSLPLNMLYVPLYSMIILPFALFTVVLLGVFEPIGEMFATILTWLLELLNHVTVWFSQFSFSVLTLGKPGLVLMILYCGACFYFLICWERKKVLFQRALLAPIVVLLLHIITPYINPYGEVTMIDVGQGDSIYIELPFRKGVYLIDTGGTIPFEQEQWKIRRNQFSTAQNIIIPFLKAKGIRSIDKLIVTHGDQDHIGGAQGLLEDIRIKEIVLGKNKNDASQEKNLKKLAAKKGIPVHIVEHGQKWKEGDSIFYILAPKGNELKENNNSVVIYTKLGGLNWLFTGDIEKDVELNLIKTYKNLRVDVLKVGHHGSKTSSTQEFIQFINPKIALIPVGVNNRFNHPHPDVIDLLKKEKIKVYRTDKDGAIQFRYFKKSGTFMQTIP
ncbi:DNA internalization-related competence protein ComEC/Rec2 [Bacillus sp. HNG]|uniref:DNA internalization-related competence protein ComEC/Rec2 n=1 Tax=Bacillus sp. HNG TaxID=2293325 RepID=UPI000E2E62EC|nr:DNA internalization-related competence protein ComEC/Rec2 [Bacillus sp. HNG]RFB17583.1 DNA internalization-related competence protein ComEC/Rec2 [Bacillus sp. HNG]